MNKKRASDTKYIIISVSTVLVILIGSLVAFYAFNNTTDNPNIQKQAEASDFEIEKATELLTNFLEADGNIGEPEEITADMLKAQALESFLAEQRIKALNKAKNYMMESSPMLTPNLEVQINGYAQQSNKVQLFSLDKKSITIDNIGDPEIINLNQYKYNSCVFTVSFVSYRYIFQPSARDSSWDGTYQYMKVRLDYTGVKIKVIDVNGTYLIYDVIDGDSIINSGFATWSGQTPEAIDVPDGNIEIYNLGKPTK